MFSHNISNQVAIANFGREWYNDLRGESWLDLVAGPLPGFEEAMAQLYALCVTPQALYSLRAKLYRSGAYTAETCSDLLPTVAIS